MISKNINRKKAYSGKQWQENSLTNINRSSQLRKSNCYISTTISRHDLIGEYGELHPAVEPISLLGKKSQKILRQLTETKMH